MTIVKFMLDPGVKEKCPHSFIEIYSEITRGKALDANAAPVGATQ